MLGSMSSQAYKVFGNPNLLTFYPFLTEKTVRKTFLELTNNTIKQATKIFGYPGLNPLMTYKTSKEAGISLNVLRINNSMRASMGSTMAVDSMAIFSETQRNICY